MAQSYSARSRAIEPFHVMALLARANELQASGHDVIHLEIGEPDFTTAEPIVEAGQAALAAGQALPHIYLQGFWDHYLLIGGVGSTLPLAFLLLRSRAIHLRSIGKMGVVPGLFNINEPILFGAPIVMNPVFFLPFILVPMINATLAYIATSMGLVARVVSLTPWTSPAPLGASWAANWAFSPVIMCLICMVMSALMYYPFLKAYERTLLKEEEESAAEANANGQTVTA